MSRDISPPPKRRKISLGVSQSRLNADLFGPEPLPPLSDEGIRIFSWNINGIAPFLQKPITEFFSTRTLSNTGPPSASLRSLLERHKWPHILFLQEVKIASGDTKTQDAVRAAVNPRRLLSSSSKDEDPEYEVHFTLPNDPNNARGLRGNGKVYGVCSVLRIDLRQKYDVNVRDVVWDKEGRISIVELTAAKSQSAIFNIYAVNGTDNLYRDPSTGAVRGTRHDRKREFHQLLMQECKDLQSSGWNVVLAGDMNVAPDIRDGHPRLRTFPHEHVINRADFHDKFLQGKNGEGEGWNGVDVWRQTHGDEKRYTWYSRTREWGTSCDRVDFFIVGRDIWEKGMIKASGIMDSQAERGLSDHCPIWLDIEVLTE